MKHYISLYKDIRALELFAGIAGISHGLRGIVSPVAFVELNPDAQRFLRFKFGHVPIFGDISSFSRKDFPGDIDIIIAGFPCSGFSTAGHGDGFKNVESELFFEIIRLAKEYSPKYIFLENSHVLSRVRNLDVVVKTFDNLGHLGYTSRWTCIRATAVGAHHQRYRWFCLMTKKGHVQGNIYTPLSKPFKWGAEPERQVPEKSRENSVLVRLAGYSVVPDQVRYAFCGLFSGNFQNTWSRVLVPGALAGKIVEPDCDTITNGYCEDGKYYSFIRRDVHRPPLNIVLSPREIPEDHRGKNLVNLPIRKRYWATPCASYGNSTGGSNVLTRRQVNSLPTQVRFSHKGKCGWHLSGIWVMWLMGYGDYISGFGV